MNKTPDICVQYGCGLTAPADWVNYDSSATLRLQKVPLVGRLLTRGRSEFPCNVKYGDIVRGLKLPDESCRAIYASHVLEHLSLCDFELALRETRRLLKVGGRFRLVVPDLQFVCSSYLDRAMASDPYASYDFMRDSCLGVEKREHGLKAMAKTLLANSQHLWMWDENSLSLALKDGGFRSIRRSFFDDSLDPSFRSVESIDRYSGAVGMEATK